MPLILHGKIDNKPIQLSIDKIEITFDAKSALPIVDDIPALPPSEPTPAPMPIEPTPVLTDDSKIYLTPENYTYWNGKEPPDVLTPQTPQGKLLKPISFPRPTADKWVRDPIFGNHVRALPQGQRYGFLHHYSQLNPFSFDDRYMLVVEPGNAQRVLDLQSWKLLEIPVVGSGTRWLGKENKLIQVRQSPAVITTLDVSSGVENVLADLSDEFLTLNESNRAYEEEDGNARWVALYGTRKSTGHKSIATYDLIDKKFGGIIQVESLDYDGTIYPLLEPDWVSVSPLGTYLVVQWGAHGTLPGQGCCIYTLDGKFVRQLHSHGNHSDLGFDEYGREYLVTTMTDDSPNPAYPWIVRLYLHDGSVQWIKMVGWDRQSHLSCQGPDGWVLMTAGSRTGVTNGVDWTSPFAGEIYKVGPQGQSKHLVQHHAGPSDDPDLFYWAGQPKASWSKSGEFIAFASNWGQGDHGVGGFVLQESLDSRA